MKYVSFIFVFAFFSFPVFAFGTYAEGRAYVRVVEFLSTGIIFESFEGTFEVASFDKKEECETAMDCYTPLSEKVRFSVDKENKETIKFIQDTFEKVILVDYKIYRIRPFRLGTSFEVIKAYPLKMELPDNFPQKFVIKKTGTSNYSVYGKVLKLEYRGTAFKTYEGIYYDRTKDKIRPFSLTSEDMAKFLKLAMEYNREYYIGISQAIFAGIRETKYDIFEINYRERAGGVD